MPPRCTCAQHCANEQHRPACLPSPHRSPASVDCMSGKLQGSCSRSQGQLHRTFRHVPVNLFGTRHRRRRLRRRPVARHHGRWKCSRSRTVIFPTMPRRTGSRSRRNTAATSSRTRACASPARPRSRRCPSGSTRSSSPAAMKRRCATPRRKPACCRGCARRSPARGASRASARARSCWRRADGWTAGARPRTGTSARCCRRSVPTRGSSRTRSTSAIRRSIHRPA